MSMKKIPMVVHYNFDGEVPVWLFDTEEEAVAELKKQFEAELREANNLWGGDIKIESRISENGKYAEIKEYFNDHTDTTEWAIGDIKN